MYLDSENRENVIKTFKDTWEEFRYDLGQKKFEYNNMDKAKNYTFLKVLSGVLQYNKNFKDMQVNFNELYFYYSFCRATKKSDDESFSSFNYDRFIPQKEYIDKDNRFSPKGVEYLYLACKTKFGIEKNYKYIEEVALKEVRATKNNIYGLCNFNIPEEYLDKNKKLIDLTISDNKLYEEIDSELCDKSDDFIVSNLRTFIKHNGKIDVSDINEYSYNISRKFCLDTYFRILSSELFKPIENPKSKDIEYAPFHCLAYYFKQLGYDGIIYKSTVCKSKYGKNVVFFDKRLARPFGKIRFVNYLNHEIKID